MTRRVDVRVVAATNRDLEADVRDGRFRSDLFYRLGVFPIAVPPLRDRRDDIPDLIRHFVEQHCERLHVAVPRLPGREIERAQAYDWPGNVRELQNVVERAVILSRGGSLAFPLPGTTVANAGAAAMAPLESGPVVTEPGPVVTEHEWRELERANVRRALEQAGYRVYGPGGAAALLGVNGATLASRLKKLGLTPATSRAGARRGTRPGPRTSPRYEPSTGLTAAIGSCPAAIMRSTAVCQAPGSGR